MSPRARPFLLLVAFLALISPLTAQGDLSSIREGVRDTPSSPDTGAISPGTYQGDDDDSDGSWFDFVLTGLVEQTLLWPFTLPRLLLHDTEDTSPGFRPRPDHSGPGYWAAPLSEPDVRRLSTRAWFELGRDFDDLERVGLGLRVEHASRFGLDLAWSRFREDLGAAGTDELDLGLAFLTVRFAQAPRAAFRAGLGTSWLHDDEGTEGGFAARYGVEFLPTPRATLAVDADLGVLGSLPFRHLRAALGFELEGFELFTAYDAWDFLGDDLQTWSLGLRAWL